jgi:nucleoside-diphosphate-sugar epimerase
MKVAVTGAGGFIGANLVRRLLHDGHEVVAILRPGRPYPNLAGLNGLLSAEADIGDLRALSACLQAHLPDVVYHLASSTWNAETPTAAHRKAIVTGIETLLAACAPVPPRRLIVTGSAAEYGSGAGFSEESPCLPDTELGKAKAAACKLASRLAPSLGIELVWLRLFTPFGPFEGPSRLVPTVVRAALSHRSLVLRAPHEERDFFAVSDAVEALARAAWAPLPNPAILNICSGQSTRVDDLARLVFACAGAEPRWEHTNASSCGETLTRSSGMNRRAADWLGWKPRHDLASSLEQAIAWWKEHS